MKKKFVRLISAVLSAAMTLTAVPLSAFAEGEGHTHDGESNVITTPLDFREKTADENGDGWSWVYDTKTLTLDGVNIQATTDSMSVVTVPDGTEIVLNGNNTIVQTNTGDSDTYVLSAVNTNDVNCDGTMTISGDGVLNAENRSTDSMARSLGGSIILNGGIVNATGTVKTNSLEIHNDGVLNANATTASFEGVAVNVGGSITVDGNGSLTAVGCANESTLNSAILLTSNFGDKISVSENGSITVPEGNAARVGIYYSGNNGDGMDAEISGGKVTAYGAKYGIYKVNLIMSGTGSVYTTGGSYAIGQTVPTIDKDEFVVKGSTESKASESAVTGEVELKDGYYEIGGADAKTVVIKPDTSPRIILGKQTGIFKTEEFEIIEGMTEIKLKGTVYFDITLKNMSDEEFADARGYFGGDELDLSASIIKTDYGWVCMVCDTEFSLTYDTDNTLTIKCGDIVSNTVQVKSNANRFNKVTQGDNTNRTVFYTNTSQEEKDNYKLVSTYTVDSESISYNWYSTNSAYSADELGAAASGSNGEFKLADNIPVGNYVLYCDITYSDGDSTETVTEKFTFTYKECAHENGYSDGKCTNCGALCDHSDIDINTGKCNECAHQFVATISTDGSAPTGYDTLADCLDSITADTGNYVKIYQDIGDASATATVDTIDVNHNVMIDLNGHKLNNIKLGVNKDVTLTLTGTAGSYVKQVYVRKGGSFIIDSVANVEFDTIFVEAGAGLAVNDGAKVTTASLTVKASVNDDGTTTTSVKLATGMKIGGLTYWRQDGSGLLKLGNLLDVTRQALQYDESGEYHDLYKEFVSKGLPVALTVVEHTDADHKYGSGTGRCEKCGKPCEHGGDINTDNGICSICGAVVSVALYTSADGNLSSYLDADGLDSILNEYNGSGTIKLFKDYSKPSAQYDLYGELTIDVNGRQFNIRSITPCKNGKLTIKNSGNPVMLGCNVYPTNDTSYAGGTLIIDGDVVLDTSIYVYDSSTVILKDGTYTAGLYARDSKTLYDMLGEGKAFFKTDGTLFNASVKEISSSVTLIVKDHSHTYVDGKCECGYVCPHSDVDSKTGKCTECEYQYAAVIVKDGAVASVYKETEMEAAFKAADSDANTGCTLKVYKNYTGSYTKLSGKFTLWIAEKANVGTLTVSGDITVTGSKKNNIFYGDFNVADGGKLTFDENCGAMGTVSVGAGTFDCYSTFAITLNINDASSDVILHGGAFKTICYNGGGDRANAEILTLLAENRMFMKSPNPEPIDGSKTLLKDGFATTVIVIPHEDHIYDSTTGKCTICGKRCGHTDVDSKTGVCLTCEYQLTAGVSGVGTAKYFDNIDNAFTAALSAENNGCTLTLYKHCEITQSVEIGNTTVTVDVNGYSLGGEADISVTNGGVLYLKDSRKSTYYGCIDAPFSVNGGTLINGTADGGSSAADVLNLVINSAKCVEIYGGIFENVYIAHASGVALYGGRYNTICGEESNSTPVNDLLAKGYAFATLNSVTHLPESIVDGSAKTIGGNLTNVMVVAHTHTYTETNTKCACGAVLYAKVTSADGTTDEYFDSIEEGLLYADKAENKGCVFTLVTSGKLKDYITLSNGQFTITANNYGTIGNYYGGRITIDGADVVAKGHLLIKCEIYVNSGSLTLPEDSSTRFGQIYILGGTVNISEGVNADNNAGADNLIIANDATDAKVTIGGGTYGRIVLGQHKFKDVLVSGACVIRYDNSSDSTAEKTATALLYSDIAEKNNFDSENGTVSYYLFTKCEHKNEDGSYAFNEGGICKYCGSEFAASVSYTVDGSAKTELFGDIYDAFDKANEIGTATVTLYKDITNSELTQGVTITGNVTLALNGKKLGGTFAFNAPVEVSDGGMFTVGGDGKMRMPIKAYANSKLIINGGEFTSVMVYIDGDAEIGGGVIDALTIIGNAKAKISGGKFYNIEIANGSLESVLADGYAYKKDGGAWLSIAERAESVYSSVNNDNKPVNVEEAPIKSATLSTEINKLYRNSNANPTLKFNLALAHGSNLNDSYVSKRYGINSYVSGDIIYSSLSALVKDAKLSADEIIDKAGDSDAAEIYYVVTTGDGYEIKSNTVSIDLVDCDHSQVADPTADKETAGNITTPTYCEICESKFNAKITKGDDVRYYNDLDEAAKDAQKSENEGCTLYPLYNKNGYGGQLVITEGNFTLKYAVRTAFSRPIIINGKAKLTVTGRCAVTAFENQDAFIVRGGDVTFDGLATGSNVTINGGNVTMAANNINCLTIHGGNVSISSGGFAEIVTTVSDKVIADYIDHGFWVQDRGTKEWIDIYSLNKATASSTSGLTVRVCPMQIIQPRNNVYYTNGYYPGDIPSLQISAVPWYSGEVDADVAYQWIAIDENGNETEIEGATDRKLSLENLTTGRYYCRLTYSNATTAGVSMKSDVVTATITECEHSGGEATCTKKAKCEICGAEYGEPLGHDYVVIKVVEPDYRNEGYSVFECTRCKDSYIGNRVPVKPIPDVEEIAVEKTTYNEVDISWKNISGVDGYYVECYVGNQWKQIGFSTDGDRVAAKLSGLSAGLKYKVRIAAYAGSFTGKFRCFYVDTIPSPVWNINTVKATDETVRISWNRNTRADGYKVEWYIDNQWSAKTVTGNNNIAAVIDGLCAGTRYKVRVSAYKGNLYSPYTYGYIDTLPSKVTGITQAVTSSSFTLTWDKNESADGYTVQYYADGKWNEKTLTGNNKTTVTIGSLKGYKTYKVRIKAYKGELQSAFDDIYITTAPTKVSGLKVKSAVDSKAVVIWNADATADGYNVGYYIGGKWVEKAITDNKTAMAKLDGLTPYSTYKVRVRAYKGNLYGDYSYTTVTAVLSPVTDIKVVSAKRNSITVKWGKNASADGYKVEIYKGGKWVKKTLKGSANATVTIGGLRAGSVYKVRIASYKGANTSAYTYANVNTAK